MPIWAFSVGAPNAMPSPIKRMGLNEVKEAEILRQRVEIALTIPTTKSDDKTDLPRTESKTSHEQPRILKDHALFEGGSRRRMLVL
jgi:hypothetical protein